MNGSMPSRLEIKICGLTCLDDAISALDAGSDYLGFVFYHKSPRAVSPDVVRHIVKTTGSACRAVGVFVNEQRSYVEKIALHCGLHAVQLHGDEKWADYENFSIPLWRTVWFRDGKWVPDPSKWNVDRFVTDSAGSGMYGGSGIVGDWEAARDLAGVYQVMLAGGLAPENVGMAINTARPLGVDVVSGVESSPGRKSREKIFEFVKEAKRAAEKLGYMDGK